MIPTTVGIFNKEFNKEFNGISQGFDGLNTSKNIYIFCGFILFVCLFVFYVEQGSDAIIT